MTRQLELEKAEKERVWLMNSKGEELLEAFNRGGLDVVDGFVNRGEVHFDHTNLAVLDQGGMTLMHHAARSLHLPSLQKLCEHAPALALQYTYANRRPPSWLPIHCLADLPNDKSDPHFYSKMIDCMKSEPEC